MRILLATLVLFAAVSLAGRSVRLLAVDAPEDSPGALHLVHGKQAPRIDLPRLSISRAKAAVPSEAVRLHLAAATPSKDAPLPEDAPVVDLPAGDRDVLLLLLPNGKPGPVAFRAIPVDFSPVGLPEGSVLWANLTRRTLQLRLGAATAAVGPGQVRIVRPGVAAGQPYPVMVDLAPLPHEEEPRPLVRATWLAEANRRQLLFILDDPDRAAPRIVSVPDRLEPPPPAPPAR